LRLTLDKELLTKRVGRLPRGKLELLFSESILCWASNATKTSKLLDPAESTAPMFCRWSIAVWKTNKIWRAEDRHRHFPHKVDRRQELLRRIMDHSLCNAVISF
jgi:hypothetical protein